MAVTPKSAYGTLLKLGDGATPTEVFTTIDGVRDLSGPTYSMETIDATHHSSASSYREVLPSFISAGEISYTLLYDSTNTQHLALMTSFTGRTKKNYKLILTDAGAEQHAFAAYVSGMEVSAPIDDALTMSVTLAIDGAVTIS